MKVPLDYRIIMERSLRERPPDPYFPGLIDSATFRTVFYSAYRDLFEPHEPGMQQRLLAALASSHNGFLGMLTERELYFLIAGRDEHGVKSSRVATHPKGHTLVMQGQGCNPLLVVLQGRVDNLLQYGAGMGCSFKCLSSASASKDMSPPRLSSTRSPSGQPPSAHRPSSHPPTGQGAQGPAGVGATSPAAVSSGHSQASSSAPPYRSLSFQELRVIFSTLDKNNKGSITHAELIKGLQENPWIADKFGMRARIQQEDSTRDQYQLLFGTFDYDDSKTIEFSELCRFYDFNADGSDCQTLSIHPSSPGHRDAPPPAAASHAPRNSGGTSEEERESIPRPKQRLSGVPSPCTDSQPRQDDVGDRGGSGAGPAGGEGGVGEGGGAKDGGRRHDRRSKLKPLPARRQCSQVDSRGSAGQQGCAPAQDASAKTGTDDGGHTVARQTAAAVTLPASKSLPAAVSSPPCWPAAPVSSSDGWPVIAEIAVVLGCAATHSCVVVSDSAKVCEIRLVWCRVRCCVRAVV